MNPARKIFGFLITIIIGVPVLFATILSIGVTQSVVSAGFLSELPTELVKKLPATLDEIYKELKIEDIETNRDIGSFFKAMKRADLPPSQILEKSGIGKWMEDELIVALKTLGSSLRGEQTKKNIVLNMTGLKLALTSNEIKSYMKKIIERLPVCQNSENDWDRFRENEDLGEFPDCRPKDLEISDELVTNILNRLISDIPDSVTLLDRDDYFPGNIRVPEFISSLSYFLFIFPLVFIVLGSFIADSRLKGFLRWSGTATILGGLSAYGLASFLNNMVPISEHFQNAFKFSQQFPLRYSEVFNEKAVQFASDILNHLFKPVLSIGGTVAIIGLIIFALSFLVNSRN